MMPDQVTRRTAGPNSDSDQTGLVFEHASAAPAPDQAFRGLNPPQRRLLSRWLAAAQSAGIDSAEDLASRPWPVPGADTVIGVFKTGHLLASWLVVGQGGAWAVACCADSVVSQSFDNLGDALALICPADVPVRPS